jgi:uncharacterized membrane-anchored protein
MNRIAVTGLVAVSQLVLTGLAVAPQLSARVTGETYLMKVAPVDPIDPFRGAYVTLDYPDLRHDDSRTSDDETGDLYVTLVQQGDVWVGDEWTRERPEKGPYLACDDRSWQVRCGIESLFLPQAEARETEDLLADGAVAEVRIDGRGNAAVVDVRAP